MTRLAVPLAAVACFAVALRADDPKPKATRGPVTVSEEARRIHESAIVVDGHNDLPWEIRRKSGLDFVTVDIARKQPRLHTDIPRLKAGGLGCQFWSAFVPVSTIKEGTAVRKTLEQIDVIRRMVKRYPETFALCGTVDEIRAARKAGKIASLIGVEGGHSIDGSLGVLRTFYDLGVRYMTLTHTESLAWADSCSDEPKAHGLSPFGEQVVAEMNRLGMLVDISHVSAETMRHVLRVTKAPVIASHSSAFALANHPRNVPDDVLKLVAQNDGVVMINFYPGFILPEGARAMDGMMKAYRELRKKYADDDKRLEDALAQYRKENPSPRGSVHTVVDHIEHVIEVAGIDHVGLGSDFDGIGTVPEQLEDVSTYPRITQVLLDRGYTAEQIRKVLGGNALRVLKRAEEVAAGR